MVKLVNFDNRYYDQYVLLVSEFVKHKSDLIPDILELKCENLEDYQNILKEIKNRESGKHDDLDWYQNGYYYLVFDDNILIGVACIRNNLTKLGYDIWGNIAIGIRPTQRKKGYALKTANLLLKKCQDLGMKEIIVCHYETNRITPKILAKLGAIYSNSVISEYSGKEIKRYIIKL